MRDLSRQSRACNNYQTTYHSTQQKRFSEMSWVVRVFAYFLLLAFAERIEPFSSASFGVSNLRESYILTMSSSEKQRSDSRSKEFRSLKPLPCLGSYEQDMGTKYASMFLGFEQMVVQERTDGKCVCKGNYLYHVESKKSLPRIGKD